MSYWNGCNVFLHSTNRGVSFTQTGLGGLVLFLKTGDVSKQFFFVGHAGEVALMCAIRT